MLGGFAKAIFGSSNDRYVKSIMKIVDKINALEVDISAMDDDRLKGQRHQQNRGPVFWCD